MSAKRKKNNHARREEVAIARVKQTIRIAQTLASRVYCLRRVE
jgi:hypothetical protein